MLIKQRFIGLLVSIVNASNHANCISSNNKQCKAQSTLINVNPNEPPYYSFVVSLDKCDGSCNSRVATERIN